MMELNASILDYLGKYEDGIIASIGIMYNDSFYNGIFYYTSNKMILTIDEKLIELIGDVELHEDYVPLMESLINRAEPYSDLIISIKDYNPY